MCTAVTYKTDDFYFGRNLDYEFSYGESVTVTPRNYEFKIHCGNTPKTHYAIIGMAHISENYPLYYDAVNEKPYVADIVIRDGKIAATILKNTASSGQDILTLNLKFISTRFCIH